MEFLVIALIALAIYFLPTIVAFNRSQKHPYRWFVFFANLLFGFTVLGWLLTLSVAMVNLDPNKEGDFLDRSVHGLLGDGDDIKNCPYCAEAIKRSARICRYCRSSL